MPLSEKHIVPALEIQQRLSDYAVGIFSNITSRKGIKKAIKKGWITINKNIGQTGDYLIGGEELILTIKEVSKPVLELDLKVIFEDEHLAVIHKPAGITVSGNKAQTIENALPYNLKISNQSDARSRPEPIHRLDHPTSGALLIGKTRSAVIALNQLFESKSIQKVYHAICIGSLASEGIITSPIDDKLSKTKYKVIHTIPSERFGQLNLVELHPHTGRRHQLRKHLASLDCPILGDPLYTKACILLKGKGLYLHATGLGFKHPVSGKAVEVKTDLPEKFKKIFDL